MKDFAAEIRAHLDVEQFLSQAQLMLDVHETNVESVMDAMLHHLLDSDDQSGLDSDDHVTCWTQMISLETRPSTMPRNNSSHTTLVHQIAMSEILETPSLLY